MIIYYNWMLILNKKIYDYKKESDLYYNMINNNSDNTNNLNNKSENNDNPNNSYNNNDEQIYNVYYESSLNLLNTNISELKKQIKQILKINDNIDIKNY